MGRRINPIALGRPGFCNVCGKPCCILHEVGIRCFHCFQGVFVHRKYWQQYLCACGRAPDCPWCTGCRIVAIPSEDPGLDWENADSGLFPITGPCRSD